MNAASGAATPISQSEINGRSITNVSVAIIHNPGLFTIFSSQQCESLGHEEIVFISKSMKFTEIIIQATQNRKAFFIFLYMYYNLSYKRLFLYNDISPLLSCFENNLKTQTFIESFFAFSYPLYIIV